MRIGLLLLVFSLAAANGANDVSKGVATLAGAGVVRYRTAVAWGTASTLAGALASVALASRLATLFSEGIVTAPPTAALAVAVLGGAGAWVGVATALRLPVSTTHAIVGALLGAGVALGPAAVAWGRLLPLLAAPLLGSVALSYLASASLNRLPPRVAECVCVGASPRVAGRVVPQTASVAVSPAGALPIVRVSSGTEAACRAHAGGGRVAALTASGVHWLSSGAVGFARGLNDTPKIAAIGAFGLVPAGLTSGQVVLVVAGAMALGSLVAGLRVARVLGEGIIRMEHLEGLKANLATSLLVGVGANLGLPMSTTHVATGAIAGVARGEVSRLRPRTLRDLALAWTVTPLVAGLAAAAALVLAR
jgi:PiT family inorganic phosphate transporter